MSAGLALCILCGQIVHRSVYFSGAAPACDMSPTICMEESLGLSSRCVPHAHPAHAVQCTLSASTLTTSKFRIYA